MSNTFPVSCAATAVRVGTVTASATTIANNRYHAFDIERIGSLLSTGQQARSSFAGRLSQEPYRSPGSASIDPNAVKGVRTWMRSTYTLGKECQAGLDDTRSLIGPSPIH